MHYLKGILAGILSGVMILSVSGVVLASEITEVNETNYEVISIEATEAINEVSAEDFSYKLLENDDDEVIGVELTKYSGSAANLVIPSAIDGYDVLVIGNEVFEGKNTLESVVIPDTVIEIGYEAFKDCENLASVVLPKNLEKLHGKAFANCITLASIEIPKNLTEVNLHGYVNYGPFYNCSGLKTVTFEKGVIEVSENLFLGCNGLETITIPDTVVRIEENAFNQCENLKAVKLSENLMEIGDDAFSKCISLENIVIPDSVTEIGYEAFKDCENLASVILPKNLEKLHGKAFANCITLASIEIPKNLTEVNLHGYVNYGPFYNCSGLKTVTFEKGVIEVSENLFLGCNGLETITIPDTVVRIEENAFNQCENLKAVKLSENLMEIGDDAFSKCISLENIVIPDSVTEIGYAAFKECESLTDVKLSGSLTVIGGNAFGSCVSLASIEIPKSLVEVDLHGYTNYGPFYACSNLKTVTFEEGRTEIPDSLFTGCTGPETITIPETVTRIGMNAFKQCTGLKNVNLSENLTEIGMKAFEQCTSLESIDIPDTVVTLGREAFSECSSLVSAKLSKNIKKIENNTFYKCTSLSAITVPEGVEELANTVFKGCTSLVDVVLADSVAKMGSETFSGCTKLENVTLSKALTVIPDKTFYGCTSLQEVELPEGLTEIKNNVFYQCTGLRKIEIPDTLTKMGTATFYGCTSLTDVTLGDMMTSIPANTFYGCEGLESIVIPYNVTTIGDSAFSVCLNLTEISIPRRTTSIASNAFSYPRKMTVYGAIDTYAETYAGSKGMTFTAVDIPAEIITLNETDITLDKRVNFQLIAAISPMNFTDEVVWTSSNENIATVSETGLVTSIYGGTTTITVTAGEKSASCELVVFQPVESLRLSERSVTLNEGEIKELVPAITPENATIKELSYSSSDESVATVDNNGVITAVSQGEATITAVTTDGTNRSVTCEVTVVKPVTEIILNATEVEMMPGETFQLTSVVKPEDATNTAVSYRTDAWGVAEVSQTGLITAYRGGQAVITVSAQDGSGVVAQCVVNVPFTIEYELNGGTNAENNPTKYYVNRAGEVVLNAPTKEGYTFEGWYENAYYWDPVEFTEGTTGNKVLYAKWTPIQYSITYHLNGGTNTTYNPESYTIETYTITLEDASREGYIFKGWYEDAEFTTQVTDIPEESMGDIVLYAKWEEIQPEYIILDKTSAKLKKGETLTLEITVIPEEAANKNIVWTTSNSEIATVSSSGVVEAVNNGTVIITAMVEGTENVSATCEIIVPYTITYQLNGGENSSKNPTEYYNEKITLDNPIREGYTFKGWYTDKKYSKNITSISKTAKTNYTLYAKWEKVSVGKTSISSLKNSKGKKAVVKYKAVTGKKGYEISYSTDKKFKKSVSQKTTSSTSYTLKSLKKGKTYYVRVRAYKIDSTGAKVYGKYSSVKKVKITK